MKSFELKVEVGGITALIKSREKRLIDCVKEKFKEFLSENKEDLLIEASILNSNKFFKEYSFVNVEASGVTETENKFILGCENVIGSFDKREKIAKAIINGGEIAAINNFIRTIYLLSLIDFNAFMLHSSAFVKDKKAFVFFGRSGAGKSTIAKANFKSALVINEDLNFIRKLNGTYKLFSNPFSPYQRGIGNVNTAIDSIYLLKKDKKNFLRKTPKAKALGELLGSVMNLRKDKEANERLIDLCNDLINDRKCYEFHFTKEKPFLEAIK